MAQKSPEHRGFVPVKFVMCRILFVGPEALRLCSLGSYGGLTKQAGLVKSSLLPAPLSFQKVWGRGGRVGWKVPTL